LETRSVAAACSTGSADATRVARVSTNASGSADTAATCVARASTNAAGSAETAATRVTGAATHTANARAAANTADTRKACCPAASGHAALAEQDPAGPAHGHAAATLRTGAKHPRAGACHACAVRLVVAARDHKKRRYRQNRPEKPGKTHSASCPR
jgi:hypothetical protein